MFYAALIAVATIVSVWAALSEIAFPWGTRLTTSHRYAEAGVIGFIIGLAYVFMGRFADTSAWGFAGLTMMILGAMVGFCGLLIHYGKYEMEKQPAVAAARRNQNRGPRSFAP